MIFQGGGGGVQNACHPPSGSAHALLLNKNNGLKFRPHTSANVCDKYQDNFYIFIDFLANKIIHCINEGPPNIYVLFIIFANKIIDCIDKAPPNIYFL